MKDFEIMKPFKISGKLEKKAIYDFLSFQCSFLFPVYRVETGKLDIASRETGRMEASTSRPSRIIMPVTSLSIGGRGNFSMKIGT